MKPKTESAKAKRPYSAPRMQSSEVKTLRVFQAACDPGEGFGKFRKPAR
jgi:hypothetical protein